MPYTTFTRLPIFDLNKALLKHMAKNQAFSTMLRIDLEVLI